MAAGLRVAPGSSVDRDVRTWLLEQENEATTVMRHAWWSMTTECNEALLADSRVRLHESGSSRRAAGTVSRSCASSVSVPDLIAQLWPEVSWTGSGGHR